MKIGSRVLIERHKLHKGKYPIATIGASKAEHLTGKEKILSMDLTTRKKYYTNFGYTTTNDCSDWYIITFSNNNQIILPGNQPIISADNPPLLVKAKDIQIGATALQLKYSGMRGIVELRGKKRYDIYSKEKADRISNAIQKVAKLPYSKRFKHDTKEQAVAKRMKHKIGKTYRQIYGKETAEKMLQYQSDKMSKQRLLNPKWRESGARTLAQMWEEDRPSMIDMTRKAGAKAFLARSYPQTEPEEKVEKLLNKICPGFVYNGAVAEPIQIGYRTPDFIWEDTKKVIEVFGCYWHACPSCERGPMPTPSSNETVYDDYNEHGYECLVVWEHELWDMDKLAETLKTFSFNPNIEIVYVSDITHDDKQRLDYDIMSIENCFIKGILVGCMYSPGFDYRVVI